MSLANDALYIIRGGLGDQQITRWSDKFILSELNRAIQRMLVTEMTLKCRTQKGLGAITNLTRVMPAA